MAQGGLDTATWLTLLGVFVFFFVFPMSVLELDRRKKLRAAGRAEPTPSTETTAHGGAHRKVT